MIHPSKYEPAPFGGYTIVVVDAGTVIADKRTDREETVTDGSVVAKGRVLYCTPFMEKALKSAITRQQH